MRKVLFLTSLSLCAYFISNAQISKGSTFLGGSLGFNSSSNKNDNSAYKSESSNWSINPQFGKAIGENKILGVFLGYGNSKNENTNGSSILEKNTGNFYGGGVFYRRYFRMASRFFLFGESSLGFNLGKQKRDFNNVLQNKINYTGFNFGITPGLSFAAGRKIHLEASLNNLLSINYQLSKQHDYNSSGTVINTQTQKQFGLGANATGFSNLSVGIRWILPSK